LISLVSAAVVILPFITTCYGAGSITRSVATVITAATGGSGGHCAGDTVIANATTAPIAMTNFATIAAAAAAAAIAAAAILANIPRKQLAKHKQHVQIAPGSE
jgi:hypothetical protein